MAAQPPQKASFSLYADLLEPEKQKASSATISGAPVKYDVKAPGGEEEGAKKKDGTVAQPVLPLPGQLNSRVEFHKHP